MADGLPDWQKARTHYSAIIAGARLLDPNGDLDTKAKALQADPSLLAPYLELGAVYHELARRGQKFQFNNALKVFQDVRNVTVGGSEPWWIAQYLTLTVFFERVS